MSAAKPSTPRVDAMRAVRESLGLKRRELYAHEDDWTAIKVFAVKLQMKRAKKAAKRICVA